MLWPQNEQPFVNHFKIRRPSQVFSFFSLILVILGPFYFTVMEHHSKSSEKMQRKILYSEKTFPCTVGKNGTAIKYGGKLELKSIFHLFETMRPFLFLFSNCLSKPFILIAFLTTIFIYFNLPVGKEIRFLSPSIGACFQLYQFPSKMTFSVRN